MPLRLVFASLLLSACATPLERVISVAGDVPEWFDERRAEVRGDGYPALASVPNNVENPLTEDQIQETSQILNIYDDFLDHPRAEVSNVSPEDIESLRAQLLAGLPDESSLRPMTVLSDAEIEAIRAVFLPYSGITVDPES